MSIIASGAARPQRGYGPVRASPKQNTARHHPFYFTSTRGQHILKNPGIVRDMIDRSGIKETDIVLEIGPGTGNLTAQLLERCQKVIAVEVDPRMVSELKKRFQGSEYEQRLQIIHGDAIKVPFPFFNLCISNTPYQISSPLVFKLLAHRPQFRCAVLMLQDEFGRRMVARPGDLVWSRLAVNCQLLSRVAYLRKVGRNNFRPPPKVESCLIRIEPRQPAPSIKFTEWDAMIRIAFERRNRLLSGLFTNKGVIKALEKNHQTLCELNGQAPHQNVKEVVKEIIRQSGLADKRPRHLDIVDFLNLLGRFNDRGLHFK